MSMISLNEIRLIVANSASERHQVFPKEKSIENNQKYYTIRISLIKTLKTYVKKGSISNYVYVLYGPVSANEFLKMLKNGKE